MNDINPLFNSDECRNCSVRGDLDKCRLTPCVYHNTWIVKELESRISAMQEVCEKARGAIDPKMIKIHGGKCICAHCELIRAIDKLNEVIA